MTQNNARSEYRSGVLFMLGLAAAACFSLFLEGGVKHLAAPDRVGLMNFGANEIPVAPRRQLTSEDMRAARVAWQYVVRNTRSETGLVDSVAGFPSTTMWDQGSLLLALQSAKTVGIITPDEFDHRLGRVLDSFEALPLFEGKLPNKAYDTRSLEMVDYQNRPSPDGIGWSALDVARVLSALRSIERSEPQFGARIRRLLGGWELSAMTRNGQLIGARKQQGNTDYPQEGRIGYEQYAARAAALWGLDVLGVISAGPIADWTEVSGVEIPIDRRDHSTFKAITPVLSEPFILQGLELGFDTEATLMASRVYRAQEARYRETGIPTMVSEDHLDQPPYFAYSSVFTNGKEWSVVNENGKRFDDLRTISVKSVFAWDAIYHTEYTRMLRRELSQLADPENGWPAGIYEMDGRVNTAFTLNTNAIVLEAIHNIAHGPLWQAN